MPVKVRLARHGKKGAPFYHIVIADSRAPRDGRYIERIGSYNPNTNPALVDLNFERALHWIQIGAQPTDTVRNILSNEGVMHKNHLIKGVKKGAHSEEEAERKYSAWRNQKDVTVQTSKDVLTQKSEDKKKVLFEAETAVNEARKAVFAKREAEIAAVAKAKADEAAAALKVKTDEIAAAKAKAEEAAAPAAPAADEAKPDTEAK